MRRRRKVRVCDKREESGIVRRGSWHSTRNPIPAAALLIVLVLLTASCTSIPNRLPTLYHPPELMTFAGELVPTGYADVERRISNWYNFFLSKPWQIAVWLERAEVIFPFVEEQLELRSMPLDLKYVAVAESYLDPRAISAAGAAGIWQFTEGTARSFGLQMNEFVDGRYDYVPATRAALGYLERAKDAGGSWTLACAAFNLGIRGVTDRIERQDSADYWAMVFPQETEDYLPKIIAIKLIMENADVLELNREQVPTRDGPSMRVQKVDVSTDDKPIYLTDLGELVGLTFRELWLMNPHIWKPYLPPGSYGFYLPDREDVVAAQISSSLNAISYVKAIYLVQDGDTLRSVAEKLGVTADELASFNGLHPLDDLDEGDEIVYWTKQTGS